MIGWRVTVLGGRGDGLPSWAARALAGLAVMAMAGAIFWGAGQLSLPERRAPRGTPADRGVAYQALTLHTDDGLALAAWVVEPAGSEAGRRAGGPGRPPAVVLIFHAKDGCRSPARLALVAELGLAGLAIDHRAHGQSEGLRTGFGWFERLDVVAAVGAARERWGDSVPLIGWGTSLGAAALLLAIDPDGGLLPAETFDGLLLESLYVDLQTAWEQRVALSAGRWAVPWAAGLRRLVAWRAGLTGLELSPRSVLQRLARVGFAPSRLLLAGGEDDRHATPEELASLAEALPGCAVELLPGVGHVDLLGQGPPSWRQRIVRFLREHAGHDGL